ncbi:MAG: LCP family protein [Actinomycetota bacterium]|nr:LCP family protein [Actinomycetota bacterium]
MAPEDRRFNDDDYFSDREKEDYFFKKEKDQNRDEYYRGKHGNSFDKDDFSSDNYPKDDYLKDDNPKDEYVKDDNPKDEYVKDDYAYASKKDNKDLNRYKDRFEDDFFKDEDFDYSDNEDIPSDVDPDEYSTRTRKIKQKKRKRKIISSAILIFIVIAIIAVGAFFLFKFFKNKISSGADETTTSVNETIDVPSNLALSEDISMVVAGARENLLEPDINFIFYSKFDSKIGKLTNLAIPVNTLMDIPGFGLESTDKAVEYGGMDLLMLTLKKALAMDINRYMIFDIKSIVDKIGGININLDSELTISNSENDEEIILQAGDNKLDGTEAVSYLKHYSGIRNEVPISQTANQKKIFDAILLAVNGDSDEELQKNLNSISNYFDTNIDGEEIFQLFSTFAKLPDENNTIYPLDVTSVELEGGNIFYVPDISKLSSIFDIQQQGTESTILNKVTSDLQVLNGAGTPGIAGQVSSLFKDLKYDDGTAKFNVLQAKDADNYNYTSTQIIVNSSDASYMALAEEIKTILKAGNITQNSDAPTQNIVIIVGADYGKETATETTAQQGEAVKINILNGVGTAGLAGKAKAQLEKNLNSLEKIVEVTEVKDAANFNYNETEIIFFENTDLINNVAQQIQKELGAGVIKYSDTNPDNVKISIILGKDYTAK